MYVDYLRKVSKKRYYLFIFIFLNLQTKSLINTTVEKLNNWNRNIFGSGLIRTFFKRKPNPKCTLKKNPLMIKTSCLLGSRQFHARRAGSLHAFRLGPLAPARQSRGPLSAIPSDESWPLHWRPSHRPDLLLSSKFNLPLLSFFINFSSFFLLFDYFSLVPYTLYPIWYT